jgi:acetylornithine deacetylase
MTEDLCAEDILDRLIGFRTVAGQSNLELMDWVHDYLVRLGLSCRILPGAEPDRVNLFATMGDAGRAGYILSGHVDVVPAGEPDWRGDPFSLRCEGERLIGRGACDMKGFVAAVLAAVAGLDAASLSVPIHIALSYDEELGCKGVPHLIAGIGEICAPPKGCIVGEPTGMVPVLAHKGKAALRLVARGTSGHSSRPDRGDNAIHALLPALSAAQTQARALAAAPRDTRFEPPYSSLQVGTIRGGQALNIIPDHAEAEIEARAIAGVNPVDLLAPVVAAAGEKVTVQWLSDYPALALDPRHDLVPFVEALSGHAAQGAVSFGTEAGLFQAAGIPAVVCGPGDIARAHKAEEYLTRDELTAAVDMVRELGRRLTA